MLLAFRSEPSLGCGSAAWIQYAVNKNLAEQEAVRQFCAGLRRKRLRQGASIGAALVVLYTCGRVTCCCYFQHTQEGATALGSMVRDQKGGELKDCCNK